MKRRSAPQQLDLFALRAATARAPSDPRWLTRFWPDYVADHAAGSPTTSPLVRWAETFDDLPSGAWALLLILAREASPATRSCRLSLSSLAGSSKMARNTCKRHLEDLLASRLVMMKALSKPTGRGALMLGYEFRLIVDLEDLDAAIANGFKAHRIIFREAPAASGTTTLHGAVGEGRSAT